MKNKKVLPALNAVGLLASFVFATASYGQALTSYGDFSIDQTIANWSFDNEFTFTAPEAGYIVQIRFNTNQSGPTANLEIYDTPQPCFSPAPPMNLLGSSAPHTPTAGVNVVTFSPPVPVAAGETVYIWPGATWNIHPSSESVDDPDVGTFDAVNCAQPEEDEEMSVAIDMQTESQPVPTLGVRGLFVLCLMVLCLGSAGVKRNLPFHTRMLHRVLGRSRNSYLPC